MAYLVDAHALLWHRNGDEQISLNARKLLASPEADLFISHTTFWEMVIKESLGKLKIRGGVESLYREWIVQRAANSLPIAWAHILRSGQLPQLPGDPFDRLLIAQALVEDLTIITGDPHIPEYPGVKTVW